MKKFYPLFLNAVEKLNWFPPLLARFTVGYVFFETGWGKLNNLSGVTAFFTNLGIPYPEFQAPLVAGTEFVCGLLLILGFLTRIASIPLVIVMVVAIQAAKADELEVFSDLLSFSEYLFIVLLLWLIVAGPGKVSLDRLFAKKRQTIIN